MVALVAGVLAADPRAGLAEGDGAGEQEQPERQEATGTANGTAAAEESARADTPDAENDAAPTAPTAPQTPAAAEAESDLPAEYQAVLDKGFGDGATAAAEADATASDDLAIAWSHSGYIESRGRAFLGATMLLDNKDRGLVTLGLRSSTSGVIEQRYRVRVLPVVVLDAINQELFRLSLEEGFVEASYDWLELRLGWDAPTWGANNLFSVVDVLATRDFTEGVLEQDKIGQPMLATRLLAGKQSLTLYYLSPFVPPTMPSVRSPFFPLPVLVTPGAGEPETTNVYGSRLDTWAPQAAARGTVVLGDVDLNLSYFYGYTRFPIVESGSPTIFFPLMHQAGFDGQWIWDPWIVSWEAIGTHYVAKGVARELELAVPHNRLNATVGIERTFRRDHTSFTPIVEVLVGSDSEWFTTERPPDDDVRFFRNHAALGMHIGVDNRVSSEISAYAITDLREPEDVISKIEYSERWFQRFTFILGGQYVAATTNSKIVALEQLTGWYGKLRLNF